MLHSFSWTLAGELSRESNPEAPDCQTEVKTVAPLRKPWKLLRKQWSLIFPRLFEWVQMLPAGPVALAFSKPFAMVRPRLASSLPHQARMHLRSAALMMRLALAAHWLR